MAVTFGGGVSRNEGGCVGVRVQHHPQHLIHIKPSKVTIKTAINRCCSASRHEAASRFFEKGLNPVEVATITGHKDTRMLMRYTHLRAEDLVKRLG